jgi:hypothetical protein
MGVWLLWLRVQTARDAEEDRQLEKGALFASRNGAGTDDFGAAGKIAV